MYSTVKFGDSTATLIKLSCVRKKQTSLLLRSTCSSAQKTTRKPQFPPQCCIISDLWTTGNDDYLPQGMLLGIPVETMPCRWKR